MSEDNKYLPVITAILVSLCLLWIIYGIIAIYTNLKSVIFWGSAGHYMAVGYLFIIVFHIIILILYFIHFRKSFKIQVRVGVPVFLIISFLSLAIQKVMYDEVAREYYIEYPMPGETHFIVFGLLVNGIFILYSIFAIFKCFTRTHIVGIRHPFNFTSIFLILFNNKSFPII